MKFSKLLYCGMMVLSIVFTSFKAQEFKNNIERRTKNTAETYAARIQNTVQHVITDTHNLERFFKLYGDDITKKEFEDIASIIFNDSYFLVISYQPAAVVKYVYPPEPFRWYVGANLLEQKDTQVDATYAKNSGRTVFSGPLKILDYEGVIARRPVMTEKDGKQTFWGFVTIAFDAKKLLTNVIEIQSLSNFNYEYGMDIVFQNKHIPVLRSNNFEKEKSTKRIFTLGDETWVFYLYDKDMHKNMLITIFSFFILYMTMSTVVYIIINKYEQKHSNARKMTYIDTLTKAHNRKIVDEYMDIHEDSLEKGFTLFYIDLNDFKPVNDVYGHEAGDKLLIAYVERVKHKFKQSTIVVRMGGDEFAIIINEALNEAALASVVNRIETLSKDSFNINGITIHISASIGYAQYPKDGQSMVEILAVADKEMYAWKKRVKDERKKEQDSKKT